MATITIRNLDESVKRKLQVRAALNGRSMEAEARELLSEMAQKPPKISEINEVEPEYGLGTAIHKRFAALGGVELVLPERSFSTRPLPRFEP
jgi:antitoxin FitA